MGSPEFGFILQTYRNPLMKNIFGVISILFLLNACEKKEENYSTLSIRLTDAPGPYDSVFVEIISVEVHTDVNGWQTLATHQGVYNLLELQNNVDTVLVQSQQIPAGQVSQIRLILGTNNRLVAAGISYPLSISSQDETGLKLNIHRQLLANTPYLLVMDFDALESIHETGNGSYKLKPVVRASFQ